ncbi:tetratricopeptide repeat protein [Hyphomicrobium sp.]|uniref:tetratricopeptide repeat protein n=1 Tax=Hyphomicrobium sp. TaxID=82 RepID=UPI003F716642
MKRKIAAVLMADVAGFERALAEDEPTALSRLAANRAVIEGIVTRGGGRILPAIGEAVLADFNSAVEAVRAAVDVQETLRARNKPLGPAHRVDFRLGITIGEVMEHDHGAQVTDETLAGAAQLVSLAVPGGVCISRSVREAVASKLKLKFQDLTEEGEVPDPESGVRTAATYRVASERPALPARPPLSLAARLRAPAAFAGVALAAAVAVIVAIPRTDAPAPNEAPKAEPHVAAVAPPVTAQPQPAAIEPAATPAPAQEKHEFLVKPAPNSGRVEFLPAQPNGASPPSKDITLPGVPLSPSGPPAVAPDPASILTARRMLPQAWRDCHASDPRSAATACKTLIDSGIAKDEELAHVQIVYGKALRDTNQLDAALQAFNAAVAMKQDPVAYGLRGTVQYQKGDLERAIADYSEAIRLDSGNGEALNNRAWTYYRTGRAEQALADADAAVRLLAKEAYVWDTRAHIHAKLGNRDLAIRDFRTALKIDPASATSKEGLSALGVN